PWATSASSSSAQVLSLTSALFGTRHSPGAIPPEGVGHGDQERHATCAIGHTDRPPDPVAEGRDHQNDGHNRKRDECHRGPMSPGPEPSGSHGEADRYHDRHHYSHDQPGLSQ